MGRTKPIAPNTGPVGGAFTQRMSSPMAPMRPDAAPSRYQSFIERFIIERCGYWPKPGEGDVLKAAWEEIQFGTSVWNMIRRADEAERTR